MKPFLTTKKRKKFIRWFSQLTWRRLGPVLLAKGGLKPITSWESLVFIMGSHVIHKGNLAIEIEPLDVLVSSIRFAHFLSPLGLYVYRLLSTIKRYQISHILINKFKKLLTWCWKLTMPKSMHLIIYYHLLKIAIDEHISLWFEWSIVIRDLGGIA